MSVTITRASAQDADACAGIVNRWVDRTPWMPRVQAPEAVVAFYRDEVLPKQSVWVARAGEVSGFAAVNEEGAHLTALYCATTGQGIGRALLDQARAARKMLSLRTFVANHGARRFYARAGFVEHARSDGANEEGLPDILLRWTAQR